MSTAAVLNLAQRMSRLGTETAFEVLARAKALEAEGRSIIHLEIGEPDFDTPRHIVDAAVEALRSGQTHYGPSFGLPATREAIARDFTEHRGVEVTPDRVVVLAGGKPAIFFVMLAMLEAGDEAIYPNPGFPIYESMIRFSGARAVAVPLRESREFRVDVEELKSLVTAKTKLIIINSPQNPTGSVLTPAEVKEIAEFTAERGILLFSDEIYSHILYEGEHDTPLRYGDPERMVVLDGFSKTYAMTGWRLGYSITSVELAQRIARLQTNCNSCPASFTQIAALAALEGDSRPVTRMVSEFQRRRKVVVDGLNGLPGVSCVLPHGAFYAFANIRETGRGSRELQDELLEKAGVATLSGTSFGDQGEGYLRLSYANSVENIEEAIRRIDGYLRS